MDFSSSPRGLVTPLRPPKRVVPEDEPSDEMLITEPVIGPAKPLRPAAPSATPGVSPSDLSLSLAEELCWKVPQAVECGSKPVVARPIRRGRDRRCHTYRATMWKPMKSEALGPPAEVATTGETACSTAKE